MDFTQIRHFLAVAETLHFGRAAQAMSLAQPHLSRSIARLEAELGVSLFERTSRRVSLTPGGLVFREEAREMLRAQERLVSSTRDAMQAKARTLRIAFVSAALYEVLPRLIRDLRAMDQPIHVELQEATTNSQVDLLAAGRIDLGLMHPPVVNRPRSISETLTVDRFDAVLPADHHLAAERTLPFASLAAEPFVLFPEEQGPTLYAAIRDQCRIAGHPLTVSATAPRLHSQLSFVSAGLGIGLAPRQSRSLTMEGTVRVPLDHPYPETLISTLAALWDPRRRSVHLMMALDALRRIETSKPKPISQNS